MIGSESIDTGLENIWRSWFAFQKGKRRTAEMENFQYNLEKNLYALFEDLNNNGAYRHGGYRKFIVRDNKRREISVAGIRDRIVHRLVYDYLVPIYDKTFIYDAWSCRKNKGLLRAIERTQFFLRRYSRSFVWKGDVKKFFDNVNHAILREILSQKIKDKIALELISKIIQGFNTHTHTHTHTHTSARGIAIGNLTSQIFANIYLNEFDRFVEHELKPQAYLRYGDDFILIEQNKERLIVLKTAAAEFLKNHLKLAIHPACHKIFNAKHGLKFLGVFIRPWERLLNRRNMKRIRCQLNARNVASYRGLILKHGTILEQKEFSWGVFEKFDILWS